MKKVLSVALASAMVLGMGANAFAISYSTGSNDEADWPDNFQFDGQLFVTDKDGDIIEESTTELNDSESVDFEPGDVIWMPLYADDQYQWKNTWTEGTEAQDAVKSVKLDSSYFDLGEKGNAPSAGTVEDFSVDLGNVGVTLNKAFASASKDDVEVAVGNTIVNTNRVTVVDDEMTIEFALSDDHYKAIYGEAAPKGYKEVNVEIVVSEDQFTNDLATVEVGSAVIATVTVDAVNAKPAVAPALKEVPKTVVVVDSDDKEVERTVESAKATINGKTYTIKDMDDAHEVQEFIDNVNEQFQKMVDAGKTVTWDDAVVTVNLAKIKGTDDVIDKPYIDSADEDKVMADYGHYTGNIDKNWSINLIEDSGNSSSVVELIEKAELYKATATDYASYSKYTDEIMPKAVYLKITLKDTWKSVDEQTLKYYVYIADNDSNHKTNEVWVSGTYANNDWEYVNFDWTNNASVAKLWKVKKGENGTAVFDFADKAFFTVKMYSGESMYLDLSTAYDKAIAAEMDAEADSFYKFDNDNANFSRTGELIIVTNDSSLVPYEIDEDGNFVEVDAKYVENYAIAHTNKKVDGFVFSTKTLGNYVLSTEELGQEEQPAEETPAKPVTPSEPTTETPSTSKPNPETGAEDFVGLAVSLAVVSVAAAGALTLKK